MQRRRKDALLGVRIFLLVCNVCPAWTLPLSGYHDVSGGVIPAPRCPAKVFSDYRERLHAYVNKKASCDFKTQEVQAVCGGFGRTQMPNLLNHYTQDSALRALRRIDLSSDCSAQLRSFLCMYHFPPCIDGAEASEQTLVVPCRRLCERVKAACSVELAIRQIPWPESMQCEDLPLNGDPCLVQPGQSGGNLTEHEQPCFDSGEGAAQGVIVDDQPDWDHCHPSTQADSGDIEVPDITPPPEDRFPGPHENEDLIGQLGYRQSPDCRRNCRDTDELIWQELQDPASVQRQPRTDWKWAFVGQVTKAVTAQKKEKRLVHMYINVRKLLYQDPGTHSSGIFPTHGDVNITLKAQSKHACICARPSMTNLNLFLGHVKKNGKGFIMKRQSPVVKMDPGDCPPAWFYRWLASQQRQTSLPTTRPTEPDTVPTAFE